MNFQIPTKRRTQSCCSQKEARNCQYSISLSERQLVYPLLFLQWETQYAWALLLCHTARATQKKHTGVYGNGLDYSLVICCWLFTFYAASVSNYRFSAAALPDYLHNSSTVVVELRWIVSFDVENLTKRWSTRWRRLRRWHWHSPSIITAGLCKQS